MRYLFFKDTQLSIDQFNCKIVFNRGLWNFSRIELNYSNDENKIEIFQLFQQIKGDRFIDSDLVDEKYAEAIDNLVKSGFIYPANINSSEGKGVLLICDELDIVKPILDFYSVTDSVHILSMEYVIKVIFQEQNHEACRQNPIVFSNILENWKSYISENDIGLVVNVNVNINNEFCKILNLVEQELETIYILLDKDFGYIFSTRYQYSGCYECFYKRMLSKMTSINPNHGSSNLLVNKSEITNNDRQVLSVLLSILVKNLESYQETSVVPLFGRIGFVYYETLEIGFENLLRLSFCESCGVVSRMKNTEKNIRLRTFLQERLSYENKETY